MIKNLRLFNEPAPADIEGALLGMCNPLLDISAEVPEEILTKYDVKLNNAILAEEKHIPLYQDLIDNHNVKYIAGGATQNSIRVAQWKLGHVNTRATSYFGAIGTDKYGETLEKYARDDNVNVHYQKNPELPTGTCAVLIHGGERSLVANLGAANSFQISHLETEESKQIIEKAKFYYVSGFFLTVSVDSILSVAKHSIAENKVFAINLSAPFVVDFFGEQLASVMLYADLVFGNESEAAAYGKSKGYGEDLHVVAKKLSAEPKASGARPRIVVFTQGSSGTIVAAFGESYEVPVNALPKEAIVDTNGAGDAFVGGFIAKLLLGGDIDSAVHAGHDAASTIIQRSGCTFP